MHPLLQKPVRLVLYLSAWLAMGTALAGVFVTVHPRPYAHALTLAMPTTMLMAFASLAAWWVCRTQPLTGHRFAGAMTAHLGAALQAAAVPVAGGAVLSAALARLGRPTLTRPELFTELIIVFVAGTIAYLLSAVIHYLFLAFESAHEHERRILETQVTAREAELKALRAQLNPHFLFNSLNSINALIGANPEAARRMTEGLGDFLRRSLSLGGRETVTLAEELALVDRYLAIEQVRFGERLGIERRIEPAAAECLVPPLLLQPLVENAIKHGVADRIDGGTILIEARLADGRLVVQVENAFDPDAPPRRGAGVGLENTRRRVEALDPRDARLDVLRGEGRFVVRLHVPARMSAGHALGRSA